MNVKGLISILTLSLILFNLVLEKVIRDMIINDGIVLVNSNINLTRLQGWHSIIKKYRRGGETTLWETLDYDEKNWIIC